MEQKKKNIKILLINVIFKKGKKSISEKLVLKSFKSFQKHNFVNHTELTKIAIRNYTPVLNIKETEKKKNEITYYPVLLKQSRRILSALKTLLKNLLKTNSFIKGFIAELNVASKDESETAKKLKESYESSFENKKYANFKWV